MACPKLSGDSAKTSPVCSKPDVRPAQSFFARWPRLVEVSLARVKLKRSSENVLRQVGLSVFGIDERYRRIGVPISERVLATNLNRARSGVHEAVTELLQRGILVRRVDGGRRNAYRYQITHPSVWRYGDDEAAPAGLHTLTPDHVEGWAKPLLRFQPQTRGYCEDEVIPEVVHKVSACAQDGVSTHARSFSGVEDDLKSREISLVDRYWVTIQTRKVALVELVSELLNEWCPGWESLGLRRIEDVPSGIAVRLAQAIPSTRGGWTALIIRQAVVRASELAQMLKSDQEEIQRLEEEKQEAGRQARGGAVVAQWNRIRLLVEEAGSECEGVDAAVGRIAAGNLCELEVAEALVEAAETELQFSALKPASPAPEPDQFVQVAPLPPPASAPEMPPAKPNSASMQPMQPMRPVVLPLRPQRPPPVSFSQPNLTELTCQAEEQQLRLSTLLADEGLTPANRALLQSAQTQIQQRMRSTDARMLGLAVKLARTVLLRANVTPEARGCDAT